MNFTAFLPTEVLIIIFDFAQSQPFPRPLNHFPSRHSDSNSIFKTNLILLSLNATSRRILANTPLFWNTIFTKPTPFSMLETTAFVLAESCFAKVYRIAPTETTTATAPLAVLLFKCKHVQYIDFSSASDSLDISELICRITTLSSAEPPRLQFPQLIDLNLEVKNYNYKYAEIRELTRLLLSFPATLDSIKAAAFPTTTAAATTSSVKPVPCIQCNAGFAVQYPDTEQVTVYERNCSICFTRIPVFCVSYMEAARVGPYSCGCGQECCPIVFCSLCFVLGCRADFGGRWFRQVGKTGEDEEVVSVGVDIIVNGE
ncbi:hypothetical protein BDR26DRAFT_857719 [Obelidium mucronatum]|nr:hypothetical protein BDR26DRAFT_857719 [Obelidium mucronatum]